MPKPPRRPPELANRMFRGADALRSGLLTRAELRSSAWRPLFRGVYADRSLVITHRLRCLAVSEYLLPDGAVIAGRSAAALLGAPYGVDDPVEVLTPVKFGPVNGLIIHRGAVPERDTAWRTDRIRVTTPQRTCLDLVRWLDAVEAVVLLDALAAKRTVSVGAMNAYADAHEGSQGASRLRKVAALVDPAAESPQESRLRVRLILAGLPAPVCQHVIERDGRFLARVDLAWPELRIAVEYDGAWHGDRAQLERDRSRLNRILGAEWLVLHVTAQRLRDDFDGLAGELRTAMRTRRRRDR